MKACASALDGPLRGMAREYSPPVLIVALALQLSKLGRAHISVGLLTADNLQQLLTDACNFGTATRPRSASTRKTILSGRSIGHGGRHD